MISEQIIRELVEKVAKLEANVSILMKLSWGVLATVGISVLSRIVNLVVVKKNGKN